MISMDDIQGYIWEVSDLLRSLVYGYLGKLRLEYLAELYIKYDHVTRNFISFQMLKPDNFSEM